MREQRRKDTIFHFGEPQRLTPPALFAPLGTMLVPKSIQIIGSELAIAWSDGKENFFTFEQLRRASPSAENQGERDILGVQHGGIQGVVSFEGVRVLRWDWIGNYALRFEFSDGHRTGLYSYDYLRSLGQEP